MSSTGYIDEDDQLEGSFVGDDELLAPLPLTLSALKQHNRLLGGHHSDEDGPLQGEGEDHDAASPRALEEEIEDAVDAIEGPLDDEQQYEDDSVAIDSDEAELEAEAAAFIAQEKRAAAAAAILAQGNKLTTTTAAAAAQSKPSVSHQHQRSKTVAVEPRSNMATASSTLQSLPPPPQDFPVSRVAQPSPAPSQASMQSAQRGKSRLQQPAFFYRGTEEEASAAAAAAFVAAAAAAAASSSSASGAAVPRSHSSLPIVSSNSPSVSPPQSAASSDAGGSWKRKPTVLWGGKPKPGVASYAGSAAAAASASAAASTAAARANSPGKPAHRSTRSEVSSSTLHKATKTPSRSQPQATTSAAASHADVERKNEDRLRFLQSAATAADSASKAAPRSSSAAKLPRRQTLPLSVNPTLPSAAPTAPFSPGQRTHLTTAVPDLTLTSELEDVQHQQRYAPFVSSQVGGSSSGGAGAAASSKSNRTDRSTTSSRPSVTGRATSLKKKKKVPIISAMEITHLTDAQAIVMPQPGDKPSAAAIAQLQPAVAATKTRKQLQQQQTVQYQQQQQPQQPPAPALQQAPLPPPPSMPLPQQFSPHSYPPPPAAGGAATFFPPPPHLVGPNPNAPYSAYPQQQQQQPPMHPQQQPIHPHYPVYQQFQQHSQHPGGGHFQPPPPPFPSHGGPQPYAHNPYMQQQQQQQQPPAGHPPHQQHPAAYPPLMASPQHPPHPQFYPPHMPHMQQQHPYGPPHGYPPMQQLPPPPPAPLSPVAAATPSLGRAASQPRVRFEVAERPVERIPSLHAAAAASSKLIAKPAPQQPAPVIAAVPAPAAAPRRTPSLTALGGPIPSAEPNLARAPPSTKSRPTPAMMQSVTSTQEQMLMASLDRLDERLRQVDVTGEPPQQHQQQQYQPSVVAAPSLASYPKAAAVPRRSNGHAGPRKSSPLASLQTMQQRQTLSTALLDEASAPRSSAAASPRKFAAGPFENGDGGSSGGNFLTRWLSALFPDRRSRFVAVLVFLLALAVSLYWLVWTVRTKWIDEPTIQSISYEHASTLPAMFGFMMTYSVPADFVYARKVIPLIQRTNSGPILASNYINCNETFLLAWSALCQPLDPNTGLPIFSAASAPSGELDGASAQHMDLSRFPLQFLDQFNDKDVCFQLHLMQNQTFATELTEVYDNFNLVGLSAGATLSALELIAAGHTEPQDPVVYAIATADGTAQLGAYAYNRLLELQFAATRSIDIEGRSSIEYAYQVVTNLPRSPGQTARDFQQLLDSCTPAEAARLQQLMQLPSTSYQSTRLCVQPRNFQVQVIKSLRLYNFASFLADLGGALNILSLSLLILFPLSASITRPRSFLPLWVLARWQNRRRSSPSGHDHEAEAEMMSAAAARIDGTTALSNSSSFSLEPSASFGSQQGVPLSSPRGYLQQSG